MGSVGNVTVGGATVWRDGDAVRLDINDYDGFLYLTPEEAVQLSRALVGAAAEVWGVRARSSVPDMGESTGRALGA